MVNLKKRQNLGGGLKKLTDNDVGHLLVKSFRLNHKSRRAPRRRRRTTRRRRRRRTRRRRR